MFAYNYFAWKCITIKLYGIPTFLVFGNTRKYIHIITCDLEFGCG